MVVIQSKNTAILTEEVAKLLTVGDELVSINSLPLSRFGATVSLQLEHLRNAPRPVNLGFASRNKH
jgi:hypothetical protein